MATLNYTDLQNLIVLSRRSLPFIADKLSAAEGTAAFSAIGNAEAFLAAFKEKQEQDNKMLEGQPNVHVVEIKQENT